jgi:glycyl-tRNA synthetase
MKSLEDLVVFAKVNGFIFPGSEIYGGLANTFDYGPLGALLKNNIKKSWIQKFVSETSSNILLDSSILLNSEVWRSSGHVGGFSDPLTECKSCHERFRADHLVAKFDSSLNTDKFSLSEMDEFIIKNHIKCPSCGKENFAPIKKFNMMFQTYQGAVIESANQIYLRPETAQGIFINFKNIQRSLRKKIPFGVGQVGKAFRNEITPGNFIFRTREFEQMELEFFCKPGTELEWFDYHKNICRKFLLDLGIKEENLIFRDHEKESLAFYSNATCDIEFRFPWGFDELWGIASRTDYDLGVHQKGSGENLMYLDPDTNEKYLPYVIEPSLGVERLLLALLFSAYDTEILDNNEERTVLHLHPALSPYKVAVLPLIKKEHSEKALEIYNSLIKHFSVTYDSSANIGKRYRRQDAIGTYFSVTVDNDTLTNDTVTVRYRDSMKQVVVSLKDLNSFILNAISF